MLFRLLLLNCEAGRSCCLLLKHVVAVAVVEMTDMLWLVVLSNVTFCCCGCC